MPPFLRFRTRLDAAILASLVAMAAMNVLILAQQVQAPASLAAISLPVLA